MDLDRIKCYALVLPCSSRKANNVVANISNLDEKPVYHIVTSDWTERTCCNAALNYKIPKVFGCGYNCLFYRR